MATGIRLPEINFIVLAGRVVRDAERAVTAAGTARCTMRIAVNRRYKDPKSGEWKDSTFYIDVTAWGQMADRAKERAKKGVALTVEGRLWAREYEDKSGQKRTAYEVVANRIQFLSQPAESADKSPAGESPEGEAASPGADIEEVPF